MKNGFNLVNTVRVECHRHGFLMTDIHYSLKEQYAVFSARKISEPIDGLSHSTHLFLPDHGMISGQYGLTKAEASQSLIQRFDDLQGGSQ